MLTDLEIKDFLVKNKDLIQKKDYKSLINKAIALDEGYAAMGDIITFLYESDINILKYFDTVPSLLIKFLTVDTLEIPSNVRRLPSEIRPAKTVRSLIINSSTPVLTTLISPNFALEKIEIGPNIKILGTHIFDFSEPVDLYLSKSVEKIYEQNTFDEWRTNIYIENGGHLQIATALRDSFLKHAQFVGYVNQFESLNEAYSQSMPKWLRKFLNTLSLDDKQKLLHVGQYESDFNVTPNLSSGQFNVVGPEDLDVYDLQTIMDPDEYFSAIQFGDPNSIDSEYYVYIPGFNDNSALHQTTRADDLFDKQINVDNLECFSDLTPEDIEECAYEIAYLSYADKNTTTSLKQAQRQQRNDDRYDLMLAGKERVTDRSKIADNEVLDKSDYLIKDIKKRLYLKLKEIRYNNIDRTFNAISDKMLQANRSMVSFQSSLEYAEQMSTHIGQTLFNSFNALLNNYCVLSRALNYWCREAALADETTKINDFDDINSHIASFYTQLREFKFNYKRIELVDL